MRLDATNTETAPRVQVNPYSMDNFIQPSFRRKGLNSPLLMERICAVLGATAKEIRSQKNNKYSAKRRWAIAYVLQRSKGKDMAEIGMFLQVDGTTVGHGIRRAIDLVDSDPEFASMVDALEVVV